MIRTFYFELYITNLYIIIKTITVYQKIVRISVSILTPVLDLENSAFIEKNAQTFSFAFTCQFDNRFCKAYGRPYCTQSRDQVRMEGMLFCLTAVSYM